MPNVGLYLSQASQWPNQLESVQFETVTGLTAARSGLTVAHLLPEAVAVFCGSAVLVADAVVAEELEVAVAAAAGNSLVGGDCCTAAAAEAVGARPPLAIMLSQHTLPNRELISIFESVLLGNADLLLLLSVIVSHGEHL